jgi:GAF domain-containing protein
VLGLLSLVILMLRRLRRNTCALPNHSRFPAAVAIQNARLYEQAEIFRAELEPRLIDLEQTERALKEVRQGSQCPHG